MTKKIQAYFQTENDALSANTRIQTYGAEYLEVSELPDAIGRDSRLLIPITTGLTVGGTPGSTTGYGAGAAVTTDSAGRAAATYLDYGENDGSNDVLSNGDPLNVGSDTVENDYYAGDRSLLRYVLAATVRDEVYADVVEAIRRSGGYVEVFD
ncbi:hypothetical protein [Gorillibacterium timonense]|uniref:hypothetical protein n=1 Tax=Gorillibacterium timonense TaxID=1689269 RepID=UPI00071DD8DB|nr:hypothetical protein [Gorillibacterium timonense]